MKASISSSTNPPPSDSVHAQEPTENDLLAEQVLHEVLVLIGPKIPPKPMLPSRKNGRYVFFHFIIGFLCLLILYINI